MGWYNEKKCALLNYALPMIRKFIIESILYFYHYNENFNWAESLLTDSEKMVLSMIQLYMKDINLFH